MVVSHPPDTRALCRYYSYVPLPTQAERLEILKTLTRKSPLSPDVDLAAIAAHRSCDGFSGADMSALVREAGVSKLRDLLKEERDVEEAAVEEKVAASEASGESSAEREAKARASVKAEMAAAKKKARADKLLGVASSGVDQKDAMLIRNCHFERAFDKVLPSVSREDRARYEAVRQDLRASRGHIDAGSDTPKAEET